jgi:hypothetical protein
MLLNGMVISEGGGMGSTPLLQQLYISHNLHEAKKPGKLFSRKS